MSVFEESKSMVSLKPELWENPWNHRKLTSLTNTNATTHTDTGGNKWISNSLEVWNTKGKNLGINSLHRRRTQQLSNQTQSLRQYPLLVLSVCCPQIVSEDACVHVLVSVQHWQSTEWTAMYANIVQTLSSFRQHNTHTHTFSYHLRTANWWG